jgi:hypothetical protein
MSCQLYSDNSDCLSLASSNETHIITRPTEKKDKPKRNRSAFIIFSSEMRSVMNADDKQKTNSNEMMVKLADLWKNLKEGDKKRYQDMAEREKVKYLTELNEYYLHNPLDVIQNKTKKNHIKKPCSAYGLFLKEAKDVVKSENANLKMADVLKVVAEKWKSLDEKHKMKYQVQAQAEKELVKSKIAESATNEENAIPLPQKRIQSQKRVKKALIRETVKMNNEGLRIDEVDTSDASPFEDAVFATRSDSSYTECRFAEEAPNVNFSWNRMPTMEPVFYNNCQEDIVVKRENEFVADIYDMKNKKSNDFLFDLLNFQTRKDNYEQDLYFTEAYTEDNSVYTNYRAQPVMNSHMLINESLVQALDFGLNDIDFDCFNFENTYQSTLTL